MDFANQLESFVWNFNKKLTRAQVSAFVAAIIAGFLAHGYVFFNRLSYHDNSASLFSLGATYESGRWFLGIIYKLMLLTTKTYSVPVFNGVVSLLFIAVSAIFVVEIFDVKSKAGGIYIGAMMAVYPVVTSIFSFMFTSWPYFLALLLAVLSARAIIVHGGVRGVIEGIILLALSLGIYQAFFAVTITILLFRMLLNVLNGTTTTVADYGKGGILALISLGVGLGLWGILRKVFQTVKHIEAVDYKGMDEAFSVAKLPDRFMVLIKSFFGFRYEGINSLRYLRLATMVIFVVALIQLVVLLIKRVDGMALRLSALVGVILLPVGMGVVYLLSTSSEYQVDSLMLYGDIFVLIIPVLFIEFIDTTEFMEGLMTSGLKAVTWLQIACMLVMAIGYIYLDNAAYMKADLIQEEATAYFTELAANIKACPGFDDDMEIVLVGWDDLEDGTMVNISPLEQLDGIQLEKYPNLEELVTYSGSIHFMREHVGFGNDNVIIDEGELADDATVKAMPCYPDDGSIAVVDGRLIVKLGQ